MIFAAAVTLGALGARSVLCALFGASKKPEQPTIIVQVPVSVSVDMGRQRIRHRTRNQRVHAVK